MRIIIWTHFTSVHWLPLHLNSWRLVRPPRLHGWEATFAHGLGDVDVSFHFPFWRDFAHIRTSFLRKLSSSLLRSMLMLFLLFKLIYLLWHFGLDICFCLGKHPIIVRIWHLHIRRVMRLHTIHIIPHLWHLRHHIHNWLLLSHAHLWNWRMRFFAGCEFLVELLLNHLLLLLLRLCSLHLRHHLLLVKHWHLWLSHLIVSLHLVHHHLLLIILLLLHVLCLLSLLRHLHLLHLLLLLHIWVHLLHVHQLLLLLLLGHPS